MHKSKKRGGKDLHIALDSLRDKDGNIRPEIQLAIDASATLIKMQADGAKWEEVEKYLNEQVLNLTDDAKGYEGNEFEKLPDEKTDDGEDD